MQGQASRKHHLRDFLPLTKRFRAEQNSGVQKFRRSLSFLLVFVFAVLLLKNFGLEVENEGLENCQEFGHIHHHIMTHSLKSEPEDYLKIPRTHSASENQCQSGQVLTHVSPFPRVIFAIDNILFNIVFDLVAVLENRNLAPVLEPRLQPPKMTVS